MSMVILVAPFRFFFAVCAQVFVLGYGVGCCCGLRRFSISFVCFFSWSCIITFGFFVASYVSLFSCDLSCTFGCSAVSVAFSPTFWGVFLVGLSFLFAVFVVSGSGAFCFASDCWCCYGYSPWWVLSSSRLLLSLWLVCWVVFSGFCNVSFSEFGGILTTLMPLAWVWRLVPGLCLFLAAEVIFAVFVFLS
ncbi:hypothetical protein SK79_01226 [Escherichia coli]|nr:hypothetical protein SK79_01226 [Escherichia coli]